MEFCELLAEHRRRRGLTQQDLADRTGIHVTQLRRYEAGSSVPSVPVLRRLALALSILSDELLFDEPRRPSGTDLSLALEGAERLDPAEQKMVRVLVEGLLARRDALHRSPTARRR